MYSQAITSCLLDLLFPREHPRSDRFRLRKKPSSSRLFLSLPREGCYLHHQVGNIWALFRWEHTVINCFWSLIFPSCRGFNFSRGRDLFFRIPQQTNTAPKTVSHPPTHAQCARASFCFPSSPREMQAQLEAREGKGCNNLLLWGLVLYAPSAFLWWDNARSRSDFPSTTACWTLCGSLKTIISPVSPLIKIPKCHHSARGMRAEGAALSIPEMSFKNDRVYFYY